MNQQERQLLASIRDELREALRTSERRPRSLTDHERLEQVTLQLTRTLSTLDHRIQSLGPR